MNFRINDANGYSISDMRMNIAVKKIAEVNINLINLSGSLFDLYIATYLITDVETPKLAIFAKEEVANTTDQTPNNSILSSDRRYLYKKK